MDCYSRTNSDTVDLSVIIPMYNVENYILETLNSMRGVHKFNIELILIDDGSTDETLKIARSWASENEIDCRLISKKNAGPSIARNIGIKEARGNLITFFDSDDVALSYLYNEIIEIMYAHEVDFCIFRGSSFDHETQKVDEFPDYYVWDSIMGGKTFKVLTPHQEPRIARLEPSAVIRVFTKDFLIANNIEFPQKLFFEDVLFHAKCVLNAKKVALLNKTLLLYRVNREGQTTSSFGKKREDILKIIDLIIDDYPQRKVADDVWANLFGLLIRMTVWCSENCAYEDKFRFVQESIRIFHKLPLEIMNIYKNEYHFNEWELNIAKAFIEKNEHVLGLAAQGGFPHLPSTTSLQIISPLDLDTIDRKLDHLYSQEKEGWAHDRFNVLNSKLESILKSNSEIQIHLKIKTFIKRIYLKFNKG